MARRLMIDGVEVSDTSECYVIAEIGHNHQGNVETCKEMIRQAKECGAHAAKLQKRDNKSLFTKAMLEQAYDNENSYGPTYGTHREALEFGWDEYQELQKYCKEIGITFFATAFDFNSADFLNKLGVPAFKIASGDLKNIPLIEYVAAMGKPMIISTGGGTIEDARRMYKAVMPINDQVAILQCTAGYPPAFEELNLKVIESFREEFPEAVIGFSSHDSGIAMAVAGYVLGARVVEKHFTLNRAMKGTDHAFSLEPVGLRKMCRDLQRVRLAMGDGIKKTYPTEHKPVMKMGKKIVAAKSLPAGHVLKREDLALKSPADGLHPYELKNLIGATLAKPVLEDQGMSYEFVREAVTA